MDASSRDGRRARTPDGETGRRDALPVLMTALAGVPSLCR